MGRPIWPQWVSESTLVWFRGLRCGQNPWIRLPTYLFIHRGPGNGTPADQKASIYIENSNNLTQLFKKTVQSSSLKLPYLVPILPKGMDAPG